tara:strand:+ start:1542 stop:1754 length:213 start_codon:yes stop_codon:yes gene_type:complete
MESDKSTIDLLDMFAGYALSGYVREGVSYMSREDECKEVARACYDLAFAMVMIRQEILDERELQITKENV